MVSEQTCRCGTQALGAKGGSGGVSGNPIFSAYSHPRPPDFLPWFTLRLGESFTFSVPGGGSSKEC